MKSKEIKSKLDEIIDFSGIEEFVDTPVKRYSSGMYVRLAFSVAAHLDADILLMDEVLAVGDTEFQKKCLGKMDEVSRKGRTVLFVSHNLEAVRTLCPRTIFLENGNMVSFAETHDVIELYMTKQVTNKMSYEFKSKGSEVELCKIEIMDGQGRLGNYFSWDQSPTVKFDLIIQKLNERAVISFGLVNRFGNRIFTNDYKLNELFRDKGSHTLVIKIPPRLFTPGPYLVSFAIHIPNQDFIYLLEEKVHINFFRPDDENFIYRTDNGSIIVPCIWEAS